MVALIWVLYEMLVLLHHQRAHCTQRSHNANWPRTCHRQSRLFHRLLFFPLHAEKIRLHVISHDYIKIISYPRCSEQPVRRSSSRLWCAPGSSHSLQAHNKPSEQILAHNHYGTTTSHRPRVGKKISAAPKTRVPVPFKSESRYPDITSSL